MVFKIYVKKDISIHQWSDFNWLMKIDICISIISIHQWSDFNGVESIMSSLLLKISIHQWSDFNKYRGENMLNEKVIFPSINGLILTSDDLLFNVLSLFPSINGLILTYRNNRKWEFEIIDFHPSMVWF